MLRVQKEALDAPSATAVKASVKGGGGSFSGYFEQYIEGLNTQDRLWNGRSTG